MEDRKVWAAFWLLALAWGTSFLFIKIGLRSLQPLTLVALRLLVGWLGLAFLMAWRGLSLPRQWSTWRHLLVMGAINTAVPFVLITWAESGVNGVDSAVASILNSTVPLFSIVIAGVIFRIEEVTIGRVLGLLIGFAGVVLLLSRDLTGQWGQAVPQLAVVMAALCYAFSSTYARRNLHAVDPIILAAGQLLIADVLVWLAALGFEDFGSQALTWTAVAAILWLGLLGSCLAYILYFHILRSWGATRTTLVTYILPVVGVSAGAIFLNEALDWRLVVGGLLILSGVGTVNWRPRRKNQPQTDAVQP
jgi:drug/metabolite transporter (DMT)-like permease